MLWKLFMQKLLNPGKIFGVVGHLHKESVERIKLVEPCFQKTSLIIYVNVLYIAGVSRLVKRMNGEGPASGIVVVGRKWV